MAVLKSDFDILRGWPDGSAVAEDFAVNGTAGTHTYKAGQWVALDSGTPGTMPTHEDLANAVSGRNTKCFMIIEGREDFSAGATAADKVTVLLGGGYVARLHNRTADEMYDTADGEDPAVNWAYTPGMPGKVVNGIITPALKTHNGADLAAIQGDAFGAPDVADLNARSAIVGHVLRFDSAEAHLEILVY